MQIPEAAKRARSFAFHSWRNADWRREYMDSLKVFTVNGPVRERASWRFVETIADPASSLSGAWSGGDPGKTRMAST